MSKTKRRIVFLGLLVALAFFAAAIGLTFKPNTAYADGGLDIVSAGGNPVKKKSWAELVAAIKHLFKK